MFHSVSALTSLLSPAHGRTFAARVLFDPPVCKADEFPEEFDVATRRCTEIARRRTDRFESLEECADFLGYLPAFKRVVPGTLELYARSILRKSANGQGYVLRCPRDYEAQVINYARGFAVMVDFDEYQCPTKVIGADPVLPYSYLPTFDLSHILNVDYDFLPIQRTFFSSNSRRNAWRRCGNFWNPTTCCIEGCRVRAETGAPGPEEPCAGRDSPMAGNCCKCPQTSHQHADLPKPDRFPSSGGCLMPGKYRSCHEYA